MLISLGVVKLIGIALAMPMRAHVDRHVLECDVDIGSVIEVKPAQKILISLALPTVLGGDRSQMTGCLFIG